MNSFQTLLSNSTGASTTCRGLPTAALGECLVAVPVVAALVDLKAMIESSQSHLSFKRLVLGGFSLGFIGSSCTALPQRIA
jgi:hypothetical protein